MVYDIVMPQLGLTMTEGSVTAWLKQPGEAVEKGEILFTVETDKVEMEVEATHTGFLREVIVEPGQLVPVGSMIARMADTLIEELQENKQHAEPTAQSIAAGAAAPGPAPAAPPKGRTSASPRARKLAAELGVDIALITSTDGGTIRETDVRAFAERQAPASATRLTIAKRTAESFRTAPHFYLGVDVDAGPMIRAREAALADSTVRVTYTDFLIRALAMALAEQPRVNAAWRNDSIVPNSTVDVGVAVGTDDSLLVPVIRGADRLSLPELAHVRAELVDKARSGSLTPAEVEGGSATLSNLGPQGIDWFNAILNPPQSVLLAAGRIRRTPAVIDDPIVVADRMTLTLAADHRVLDGVAAARFLGRIRELLEDSAA